MRWLIFLLFLPIFGFGQQWPVKNINVDGSNVVTKDVDGNVVIGRNLTVNDTILTLNHGNSSLWQLDNDVNNELNTSLNLLHDTLKLSDNGGMLQQDLSGLSFDDYSNWYLGADGSSDTITSGYLVNFVEGNNITIDKTTATDSLDLTFNASSTYTWDWDGYTIQDQDSIGMHGNNGIMASTTNPEKGVYAAQYALDSIYYYTDIDYNRIPVIDTADNWTWKVTDMFNLWDLSGTREDSVNTGNLLYYDSHDWTDIAKDSINLSSFNNDISGTTDNQNISGSSWNPSTNELTIGIENGTSEIVDLSSLDTNRANIDQQLLSSNLQTVEIYKYKINKSDIAAGDVIEMKMFGSINTGFLGDTVDIQVLVGYDGYNWEDILNTRTLDDEEAYGGFDLTLTATIREIADPGAYRTHLNGSMGTNNNIIHINSSDSETLDFTETQYDNFVYFAIWFQTNNWTDTDWKVHQAYGQVKR